MILLAMMFILSSRCQAAACPAREPPLRVLSTGTAGKSKITAPIKLLSVYERRIIFRS